MDDPHGELSVAEKKKHLQNKAPSELMEEMEELTSTSDYDPELLCAYLDVLEEKSPVLPADYDPVADFEAFQAKHAAIFEAGPEATVRAERPRPRLRLKRFIAVAALICVLLGIAQAGSAGVFNRLIEWGEETFSMRPASGKMELEAAEEGEFRSLQEALDFYGVTEGVIPTWIPERFSLIEVKTLTPDASILLRAKYLAGEDELFILVDIMETPHILFEKEVAADAKYYTYGDLVFLISDNLNQKRATWTVENYACSISADLEEDEFYEVLNSIR